MDSRYYNRQAIIYYALMLPALVLELVFSAQIVSNPSEIGTAGLLLQIVQLVPFIILALSLYAIIKFRPSLLAAFLSVSFFVFVIVVGLSQSALVATTSLVVTALFLSLIGFNYARATKILGGRNASIESNGPFSAQILSTALELVLPFLAALIVVFAISGAMAVIRSQAASLPAPLSTLSSLYLDSQIGLVFASILVAGVVIWSMRQVLEPIILHFTITRSDAVSMALEEIDDVVKKARLTAAAKPSSGKVWILGGVACALVVFALSIALSGWQGTLNDLVNALKSHPVRTPVDNAIIEKSRSAVNQIDSAVVFLENLLRTIIRLLWG